LNKFSITNRIRHYKEKMLWKTSGWQRTLEDNLSHFFTISYWQSRFFPKKEAYGAEEELRLAGF
jgi:hypothetical protein